MLSNFWVAHSALGTSAPWNRCTLQRLHIRPLEMINVEALGTSWLLATPGPQEPYPSFKVHLLNQSSLGSGIDWLYAKKFVGSNWRLTFCSRVKCVEP